MAFKSRWLLIFAFSLLSIHSFANENTITENDIRTQLEALKTNKSPEAPTSTNNLLTQNLEGTLVFLDQAKKQQQEINKLTTLIESATDELKQLQQNQQNLREKLESINQQAYRDFSIADLEAEQNNLQQQLQTVQVAFSEAIPQTYESYQTTINENNQRIQKLIQMRYNAQASKSLKDKYNAEINYLELNNKYNLLISQNSETLYALDEAKRNEASLKQQLLKKQLALLQSELNNKRLDESKAQAKQAQDLKRNNKALNPLIQRELDENSRLSQLLLTQTEKLNSLSQDNLRIRNVLDSFIQTQRNIEEQISALQGTLVLSRVINQQKQALPTDQLVKGLAKEIATLRVDIFEFSQKRDELYNLPQFINQLTLQIGLKLTEPEQGVLENILQERRKIFNDIVRLLNNQLTLSINIETNQKQVIAISDSLQSKLQQQSFWVQSNNPIDLNWLEEFPKLAFSELSELSKYIGFKNLGKNLIPMLLFLGTLLLIYWLIIWKKETIKHRLSKLASQVNTLKNDSHWHTPEAMFWTVVLALPSTLMFLMIYSSVVYLFLENPLLGWQWATKLVGYWLFFATILSLLRPNGIAFRHFGMPKESNLIFQRIIKQSIWIVILLVVSSIFSQIDIIGFTNDVIGQVMTIVALTLCLTVVRPWLTKGIIEYEKAKTEDGSKRNISLFKLLRFVLVIIPLTLIVLIVLGYYYTAVYLIEHLVNSYFVALVWVFGRYFAYRSLTISSRRMAYRRLQETRQKLREQSGEQKDEQKKAEESIKISTVNQQIFRMADLIGWVILFALLYTIWSDLVSVAYYLDGVILWENTETTAKGTVVESVTLLNLMIAAMYVMITYVLVKNIAGILEVTFFSRIRLSKGTPHTLTAVLTYIIVIFGSISAFSSLGISWSKIQWVFTALSVGLGFGVREIFGSFVSGSILLFERPIRVGDKVTVGQFTGRVTKIRLRSTTLLNSDNMEVVLPNQAFVTDRFINWTLNNTTTRLLLPIHVTYGTDISLVRQILFQVAEETPKVLADPKPEVNFIQFGRNALEFDFEVYVGDITERSETLNYLNYRIDQLFKLNEIRFAHNQLDVHLHQALRERKEGK